jgi:putative tryptophan/tyrosine transport system substrate-binding protein
MKRREFIGLIGSASVTWPLAARAQQLPTIGLLGANSSSTQRQWTEAFVQRLRELGWIEGSTVVIEVRWAEGRSERYSEIAAEFVRLKVSVIVTSGTSAVVAAKQLTSGIPIIFATAGDPVGNGLVASLARPGGNVTGLSIQSPDVAGKRLELLREVVPGLRRLAFMVNVGSPAAGPEIGEVQAAARMLGLEVDTLEIRRPEDIALVFATLKDGVGGLYVLAEPLTTSNGPQIGALARAARLPTMYGNEANVRVGGLMSYAPRFPDLWRRAADYVDKILRGAKPGDLPVEQPTKFDLVINLKTAKALGLDIPATLLARADEVIE